MEKLGQAQGLMLYRSWIELTEPQAVLTAKVHDRGQVFIDGRLVGVPDRSQATEGGTFHRFGFTVAEPRDAFLDLGGWDKGVVFVNGFSIGRYWHIGPQRRLHVPYPLLRAGESELIAFDPTLRGAPAPCLGLIASWADD